MGLCLCTHASPQTTHVGARVPHRKRTPKPVYTDDVPEEVWSATTDAPAFSLDGMYTRGKVTRVWNGNTATIVLPHKGELLKFSCR